MVFKWQVKIGKDVVVPFTRGLCSVGLRGVSLEIESVKPQVGEEIKIVKIVHVIVSPITDSNKLWIDHKPSGYSIRSIVNVDRGSSVCENFTAADTELHTINLSETWFVNVSCIDEGGCGISAVGYCVLDVYTDE